MEMPAANRKGDVIKVAKNMYPITQHRHEEKRREKKS